MRWRGSPVLFKFVALKPEQAMCIQHVTEEKDVFMAAHGLQLIIVLRDSTSFIFNYQLNTDNSAVLVVSPLLLLLMEQVDGVQAETASFHYHLDVPLHLRCIKPRPCNLTSTSIISFCSHVFSAIKFAHARTVRTRLSFFLTAPPPIFPVKPR